MYNERIKISHVDLLALILRDHGFTTKSYHNCLEIKRHDRISLQEVYQILDEEGIGSLVTVEKSGVGFYLRVIV